MGDGKTPKQRTAAHVSWPCPSRYRDRYLCQAAMRALRSGMFIPVAGAARMARSAVSVSSIRHMASGGGAANFMDTGHNRVGRFWKMALAAEDGKGRFTVVLDGRRLKTQPPGGVPVEMTTRPLAEAVAAEWNNQTRYLKPNTMLFTQLTFTSHDHAQNRPRDIRIDSLMRFLETDTLLCREEETNNNKVLMGFYATRWDPLVAWFTETY